MISLQDLDMDEVMTWPLTSQLWFIIIMMLLIQSMGWWLYLQPKRHELQQLKQQEFVIRRDFDIKNQNIASLPRLQLQLSQLNKKYNVLLQQLPRQKELSSLLASVSELGIQHQLRFTQINWGEKITESFLYHFPLEIELTGDYHNIGLFSASVAQLPQLINIKEATWKRVNPNSDVLSLVIKAYTYQLKPDLNASHEKE